MLDVCNSDSPSYHSKGKCLRTTPESCGIQISSLATCSASPSFQREPLAILEVMAAVLAAAAAAAAAEEGAQELRVGGCTVPMLAVAAGAAE